MLQVYNMSNVQKVKGLTFTLHNYAGEKKTCVLAQIDLMVGFTVKDIDNTDPEHYEWCFDIICNGHIIPAQDSITRIISEINVMVDLIRVKGYIDWNDFVKASGEDWTGNGSCPFN